MDACTQACVSLVGLLGPFGELFVLGLAALVAYLSRRQVGKARAETTTAKTEAEAYKTAVLSLRPIADLSAVRFPPLPAVTIERSSAPAPDDLVPP